MSLRMIFASGNKILRLILFGVLFCGNLFSAEVPYLSGRVNDNAGVMSESFRSYLEYKLKNWEDSTSNQLVILTISDLEGDVIEDYAEKVFNTWKLGGKNKDNGVLLVISINDRQLRIEVGYGLEGYLTDALCGSIIRNEIVPEFKRNNYEAGIARGVDAIISGAAGSYTADNASAGDEFPTEGLPFPMNLIIGIFSLAIIGLFTIIGVFSKGCTSWFMFLFLIPFYAAFPTVAFGWKISSVIFVLYIVGYIAGKLFLSSKDGQEFLKEKGATSSFFKSIHEASVSGGSSFGGGGSSGGGFSGGGGSSGGGGASGSW